MLPINPASDPEADYDYASGSEEEPEKCIINEGNMISQAEQAPDVRLADRARVTRKNRTRKRRTRRAKRKASRRQQAA
jgi:hypothetical protein